MCGRSPDGWCGECRDCRRILKLQHPDVRVSFPVLGSTKPEEVAELIQRRVEDGFTPLAVAGNSSITIDSVREVQARMALRPYEGGGRVEILLDVDKMRQEAANALLKTLEEPPPGTLLVLTAEKLSAVIPTVRSRAHTIRFGRVPAETIQRIVIERTGADPLDAGRAAASADGSVGAALSSLREGLALQDVLRQGMRLLEAGSPGEIIPAVRVMTKALGPAGSARFCTQMAALLHDMRRRALGRSAVFTAESDIPESPAWPADALGRAAARLVTCESRLRSNVSAATALTAALSGAWFELREGNVRTTDAKR
jgi:DNA polymerase-3 subunit delta'